MATLCSRREELSRAATVCGWSSENLGEFSEWERSLNPVRLLRTVPVAVDFAALFEGPSRSLLQALMEGLAAPTANPVTETITAFAALVRAVPGVETVLSEYAGDRVRVWTVLDEYDRAVEDSVFAAEQRVLDACPDASVDFRILYRHGSPLETAKPAAAEIVA